MTAYKQDFKPWIEQECEEDYLPNPEYGNHRYYTPTQVDRYFTRSFAHINVKTDCCREMTEMISESEEVRVGPYYAKLQKVRMNPDHRHHNKFVPFLFCPFCGAKLEGADVNVTVPKTNCSSPRRQYTDQDWKDTLEEYRKREREFSQLPEDTQKLHRLENKKWEDEQPAYRSARRPHNLPFDYLKDAAYEMGKNPWKDV